MTSVHQELALPVARGLLGAADVSGGPTDEQIGVIRNLLHGYFGVPEEPETLEPTSASEVAATILDDHHFSGLVASLSLYEVGMFEILDIGPKVAALDRPCAAAAFADALRRGGACGTDFSVIDHLARADEPLDALREELHIPPRAA